MNEASLDKLPYGRSDTLNQNLAKKREEPIEELPKKLDTSVLLPDIKPQFNKTMKTDLSSKVSSIYLCTPP